MDIRSVRGMHDLFGDELRQWTAVENRIKSIFRTYGFSEIRTPALEHLEVFSRSVGDETDIVQKQMYVIEKESETLVLRPEGTASFVRAVLQHNLTQAGDSQRYFYYLPMFRHERPQKGRQRQFHQFGAEIIMDPTPEADCEVIALMDQIFRSFQLSDYTLEINSVGCTDCRPKYRKELTAYLKPLLPKLCEQCQARFERAPMRVLDCKNPGCQEVVKNAPTILSSLCENCRSHHDTLKKCLKLADVPYVENPKIVRGLDYYMRTAFEFLSDLLGAQSALGAGGRYDGISTQFGAKPFPGVGFGMGMERLMLALEAKSLTPKVSDDCMFFLAPLGEASYELLFKLNFALRRIGLSSVMQYKKEKGLKNLLKDANRHNAKFVVILGDDEIKKKEAVVKDMKSGEQSTVSLATLESELLKRSSLAP